MGLTSGLAWLAMRENASCQRALAKSSDWSEARQSRFTFGSLYAKFFLSFGKDP